eukprot:scaffold1484_cov241-Pinguiococcus_pyrenoidosus.AAC.27
MGPFGGHAFPSPFMAFSAFFARIRSRISSMVTPSTWATSAIMLSIARVRASGESGGTCLERAVELMGLLFSVEALDALRMCVCARIDALVNASFRAAAGEDVSFGDLSFPGGILMDSGGIGGWVMLSLGLRRRAGGRISLGGGSSRKVSLSRLSTSMLLTFRGMPFMAMMPCATAAASGASGAVVALGDELADLLLVGVDDVAPQELLHSEEPLRQGPAQHVPGRVAVLHGLRGGGRPVRGPAVSALQKLCKIGVADGGAPPALLRETSAHVDAIRVQQDPPLDEEAAVVGVSKEQAPIRFASRRPHPRYAADDREVLVDRWYSLRYADDHVAGLLFADRPILATAHGDDVRLSVGVHLQRGELVALVLILLGSEGRQALDPNRRQAQHGAIWRAPGGHCHVEVLQEDPRRGRFVLQDALPTEEFVDLLDRVRRPPPVEVRQRVARALEQARIAQEAR